MKSSVNSEWVLVKFIKKISFTSGEIEGVLEVLDKGVLISRVWVALLESLGAFGGRSKGLLSSPKF